MIYMTLESLFLLTIAVFTRFGRRPFGGFDTADRLLVVLAGGTTTAAIIHRFISINKTVFQNGFFSISHFTVQNI